MSALGLQQEAWWGRSLYLSWRIFAVAAILFFLGWFAYRGMAATYNFNWPRALEFLWRYHSGLVMTLQVSAVAAVGATVIGLLIALGRLAPWAVVRDLSGLYVHTIRNLPFIVVVLLFYFGLRKGVGLGEVTILGHTFSAPFVWGSIALALYMASYMAEIIRAGIQSIRPEQMEAARSMGMTYLQAMRYVVLPQAIIIIIPPSTGVFIGMVKESALLSIIGLAELTRTAIDLFAPVSRPHTFEFYLILAGYYLIIVVPLSFLSQWLEARIGGHSRIGEEAARGI
jgi:His/Glu/Gln/Arg/opine family amino acid ABC transporter permease subunit